MDELPHSCGNGEGYESDEGKINTSADMLEEYSYGSDYEWDGNHVLVTPKDTEDRQDGKEDDEYADGEVREPLVHTPLVEGPIEEFHASELCSVIKQMSPLKSFGSDGVLALFFQKYWHAIGDDVTSLFLSSLKNGMSVQKINHTFLAHIPKVKSSKFISYHYKCQQIRLTGRNIRILFCYESSSPPM